MVKNRQLELLVYLLQKKKSTYGQLAHHFEVSTKTIERDIDRLSASGIPVYCQQGVGGGVYLDENYTFSTSFFTPEDIAHMITALHIAKTFTANPQNEEILKKLSLISPQLTHLFQSNVEQYFHLDLYDAPAHFDQDVFLSINQCLDFKQYATVDGVEAVVCLGYVYKPDGLYLFAHAGDYRLIKIDDIVSFIVTDQVFDGSYLTYKEYGNEK
ncbi:HTH domain-containing protein [Bengtsoniella intestinalis]|uniref:helix-turn-helix transcriptional regulator n=1 Tax=Bengtsoniella intestinalis TaxID=3073143 RepID=UPI00391F82A7